MLRLYLSMSSHTNICQNWFQHASTNQRVPNTQWKINMEPKHGGRRHSKIDLLKYTHYQHTYMKTKTYSGNRGTNHANSRIVRVSGSFYWVGTKMWSWNPATDLSYRPFISTNQRPPWKFPFGVSGGRDFVKSYLHDHRTHRIHGTGIFTYIYHKNRPSMSWYKYTSPMDPVGKRFQYGTCSCRKVTFTTGVASALGIVSLRDMASSNIAMAALKVRFSLAGIRYPFQVGT